MSYLYQLRRIREPDSRRHYIFSAIANLIGTSWNIAANASQNERNRNWQESMYQRQLNDTRALRQEEWNHQDAMLQDERAYNAPENQVALLKKAGLNPALAQGGQVTAPLSSVSSSGDTPPVPNRNYVGKTPDLSGINRLGADLVNELKMRADVKQRDEALSIEQQNADTAEFRAKAQVVRDLAEAGKLTEEKAGIVIDNLFKSQSFNTRMNILKEEYDGVKLDNDLKRYDLNFMRPAVRQRIYSDIAVGYARVYNLAMQGMMFEQNALESAERTAYYRQETSTSEARQYLYESQKAYTDAQEKYIQDSTAILKEKLKQEEFITAHQGLTYYYENILKGIDSITQGASNIISSLNPFKRPRNPGDIGRQKPPAVKPPEKPGPSRMTTQALEDPVWRTPQGLEIWRNMPPEVRQANRDYLSPENFRYIYENLYLGQKNQK